MLVNDREKFILAQRILAQCLDEDDYKKINDLGFDPGDDNKESLEEFAARLRRFAIDLQADITYPVSPSPYSYEEDPGECMECGTKMELVRPGKSQPLCDCSNKCGICGNMMSYYRLGEHPTCKNSSGILCPKGYHEDRC